jgi:colicin import membrane protein
MKTIIKASEVSPAIVAEVLSPKALEAQERATAATEAFCLSFFGVVDAEREAESQDGNAWAHWVEALGYGNKADSVRDSLYATIAASDASDSDKADAKRRASGKCKNYKRRTAILLAHGVSLLGPDGYMAESCTVGELSGSLSTVAKGLLDKAASTKGAQARSDKAEDAAGEVGEVSKADAPVNMTDEVLARAFSMALQDGETGDHVRQMFGDQIMRAAQMVAGSRLKAEAIRAAQVAKADKAKADAAAKVQADAAALALQAAAQAAVAKRKATKRSAKAVA